MMVFQTVLARRCFHILQYIIMKNNVGNFICYIGQKYESDRQWEEEQEKRDMKNEKITLLKYLRISAKPFLWLLEF